MKLLKAVPWKAFAMHMILKTVAILRKLIYDLRVNFYELQFEKE